MNTLTGMVKIFVTFAWRVFFRNELFSVSFRQLAWPFILVCTTFTSVAGSMAGMHTDTALGTVLSIVGAVALMAQSVVLGIMFAALSVGFDVKKMKKELDAEESVCDTSTSGQPARCGRLLPTCEQEN